MQNPSPTEINAPKPAPLLPPAPARIDGPAARVLELVLQEHVQPAALHSVRDRVLQALPKSTGHLWLLPRHMRDETMASAADPRQ